jgi:hypothetical protein
VLLQNLIEPKVGVIFLFKGVAASGCGDDD